MFITLELKEFYLDKVNDTFTVEIYKNWKSKGVSYVRLLSSIAGIPKVQALAMKKAVNTTATDNTKFIAKDNVTYIRRDCQLENM